jgi:hypothetical protein
MGRHPMPYSYTSIMVHVVFSTKERKPQLDVALEERLYPYLGRITSSHGVTALWPECRKGARCPRQ